MSLHRLLGFTVGVPEPDGLAAYYAELGLTTPADGTYQGSDGGATVTVVEHPFRRLHEVRIGSGPDDVAVIARRLSERGATVEDRGDTVAVVDPTTRVRFVVAVADPEVRPAAPAPVVANRPGPPERIDRRAAAVFEAARPPRRLGHLVIGSPDPGATRDLLVDGLGLRVSDEIPGIIHFLRCSTDHHNVAIVHAPVPLLQHYSWECDDLDHVGHTGTALLRRDPERQVWGIGRHFAGSNLYWYLRDPSGAFVELYSDLDQILDDDAWEREGRTPFTVEHIANAWGPNLPTEFIVPTDLAELEAAWDRERSR